MCEQKYKTRQEMIDAQASGVLFEFLGTNGKWSFQSSLNFDCDSSRYRVAPVQPRKKHIHHELIKAWADGAVIEYRYNDTRQWDDIQCPTWQSYIQYRIKPIPKSDVVVYATVSQIHSFKLDSHRAGYHNVTYVFDGESGQLKSVKLI